MCSVKWVSVFRLKGIKVTSARQPCQCDLVPIESIVDATDSDKTIFRANSEDTFVKGRQYKKKKKKSEATSLEGTCSLDRFNCRDAQFQLISMNPRRQECRETRKSTRVAEKCSPHSREIGREKENESIDSMSIFNVTHSACITRIKWRAVVYCTVETIICLFPSLSHTQRFFSNPPMLQLAGEQTCLSSLVQYLSRFAASGSHRIHNSINSFHGSLTLYQKPKNTSIVDGNVLLMTDPAFEKWSAHHVWEPETTHNWMLLTIFTYQSRLKFTWDHCFATVVALLCSWVNFTRLLCPQRVVYLFLQ